MTGARENSLLTTLSNCRQAPKWSFRGRGGANEDRTAAGRNPGPGQYALIRPDKVKYSRTPCAMFGSSSRDGPRGHSCPGPGQYQQQAILADGTPKYGFGTSLRADMALRSQTPGPGTYDVRKSLSDHQVSLSMRFNDSQRASTPGPGAYSSKDCTYEASPKFGFGSSERPPLNIATRNPGPGTYKETSALGGNVCYNSPPKYSIKARREDIKSSAYTNPGPGTHGGASTQFGY